MIFTACADTVGRMKGMVNGEAGDRVGGGCIKHSYTKHGDCGGIPNMAMLGVYTKYGDLGVYTKNGGVGVYLGL